MLTVFVLVSPDVAVIPGLPVIALVVGVQIVNGALLPIAVFFGRRLARSAEVLASTRNGPIIDGIAGVTVVVTSPLSISLLAVTIVRL